MSRGVAASSNDNVVFIREVVMSDPSSRSTCPEWCVIGHDDDAPFASISRHQSAGFDIPMHIVDRSVDDQKATVQVESAEFTVILTKGDHGPTSVYFGDGTTQMIESTVESLRVAAATILRLLDDVDDRRTGADPRGNGRARAEGSVVGRP